MLRRSLPFAVLLLCASAPLMPAQTLEFVRLSQGYEADNTLDEKVLDASAVAALRIGDFSESFDREFRVCRRLGGGLPGVDLRLGKRVQFAALFAEALRNEAPKMGFELGSGGWTIDGDIKDIYAESSQQGQYGAARFWGYLLVEVNLTSPNQSSQKFTVRLHNYYQKDTFFNFSSKNLPETALARLLVEGAQELLCRLNRLAFHAPTNASVAEKIARLKAAGSKAPESLIHVIGISGSAAATAVILERLAVEKDENTRALLINALARIGTPDLVPRLAAGYARDLEDCRWYILKAMDYIDTPEAIRVIEEQGRRDPQAFVRSLARRTLR